MSDRMTRFHLDAALPSGHREPDGELAIEARLEVVRMPLDSRQARPVYKQLRPMQLPALFARLSCSAKYPDGYFGEGGRKTKTLFV